jgi:hypothetical protein
VRVRTREERRRWWRGSRVGEKADLGGGKGAAFWARYAGGGLVGPGIYQRSQAGRHHFAPPQRHMSAWWRWQACATGGTVAGCTDSGKRAPVWGEGFAHLPRGLAAEPRRRRRSSSRGAGCDESYGLVHPFVVRILLRVETGRCRCFGR